MARAGVSPGLTSSGMGAATSEGVPTSRGRVAPLERRFFMGGQYYTKNIAEKNP
jgi:hypothetical protein